MGAFAILLHKKGVKVTGSDQVLYPPMSDRLKEAGVTIFQGYRAENLSGLTTEDLVVIGNVIRRDNSEAAAAVSAGLPMTSLPEFMETFFLSGTRNVVACGTHGKTTVSAMLTALFRSNSLPLSYFIGGAVLGLEQSFHLNSIPPRGAFVLEGDEYDTVYWDKVPKFNHYLPDDVILTSIEYDHADIYPDMDALRIAFQGLLQRIRPRGTLTYCSDYPEVMNLVQKELGSLAQREIKCLSYGTKAGCDLHLVRHEKKGERFQLEVQPRGQDPFELTLSAPGQHNALNALACVSVGFFHGLDLSHIQKGLNAFQGVKRRQEVRADKEGRTVIDDFAHHPTAVRETLRAIQEKYPGRRLLVAFEPRSATSRRKVFQRDYAQAFGSADLVFIAKPFDQGKGPLQDSFSAEELVQDLLASGKKAEVLASGEARLQQLFSHFKVGDVLLILSNGGFDNLVNLVTLKL